MDATATVTAMVQRTYIPTEEDGSYVPGWSVPYRLDPTPVELPAKGTFREMQRQYGRCESRYERGDCAVYRFVKWTPGAGMICSEPYDPTRIISVVSLPLQ